MWQLRAATLAGYVGLASFPILHECTSKNILCGASSYDKYLRSADVDKHVLHVLEYIFEEMGEVFLDVTFFLQRSGYTVVVVDLVKYIGASLFCVAIDQVFRHLPRYLRIFEWRGHDIIIKTPSSPSGLNAIASAICGESDTDDSPDSESWSLLKTPSEETIQEIEMCLVETEHQQQSMLVLNQDSEDLLDCNGSSNIKTLREVDAGSEVSLLGQFPSSDESNQDQHTFKVVVKKVALQLNPYDADVSDQEPTLTVRDQQSHSQRVLSNYESNVQNGLSDGDADPSLMDTLQNSVDRTDIANDSSEQLQRTSAEVQTSGTYSSLRSLHSRRSVTRSELEPESEVYTSSEEQTSNALSENGLSVHLLENGSSRGQSQNGSSAVLSCVSDNDVFDASSYILSSRSLSSDRVTDRKDSEESKLEILEEEAQNKLIREAMLCAAYDTSQDPGEQMVRFWRLPLYHTSATPVIAAGSREGILSRDGAQIHKSDKEAIASNDAFAKKGTMDMTRHSANDAFTIQRKDLTSHSDDDLPHDVSLSQGMYLPRRSIVSLSDEVPRNEKRRSPVYTRSLSATQHGVYYPLDSDDVTWRVFFIQALCFIIIGRHWRRLF